MPDLSTTPPYPGSKDAFASLDALLDLPGLSDIHLTLKTDRERFSDSENLFIDIWVRKSGVMSPIDAPTTGKELLALTLAELRLPDLSALHHHLRNNVTRNEVVSYI